MTCATCGRTNRDDSRFCVGCGTALVARCPACGREAESDARFCGGCGSSLAAPAGGRDTARRAGQRARRRAQGRDDRLRRPRRLDGAARTPRRRSRSRRVMERYYRALRAAVEAHGGTVVKLLGDGVMAAFGVPRVAEDDAIRAVRAAVAHAARLPRRSPTSRPPRSATIGLRVAVNTGEVVVSGDNDDVVGDPVNVAARLQQEAQRRRRGDRRVDAAPGGDARDARAARQLRAERPRRDGGGVSRRVARAPGRRGGRRVRRARRRARGASRRCTTRRSPHRAARLAVLLGSPGLGKSRLIDEFARRLGDAATVLTRALRCRRRRDLRAARRGAPRALCGSTTRRRRRRRARGDRGSAVAATTPTAPASPTASRRCSPARRRRRRRPSSSSAACSPRSPRASRSCW